MPQGNPPKVLKAGNKTGALIVIVFGLIILGASFLDLKQTKIPSGNLETTGTIGIMFPHNS
jgi:hypothetical protein